MKTKRMVSFFAVVIALAVVLPTFASGSDTSTAAANSASASSAAAAASADTNVNVIVTANPTATGGQGGIGQGGAGGQGGISSATATAPTTVSPSQTVVVKNPLQIPGAVLPNAPANFIDPMAGESACSVFLPAEMTVASACKCAGESSNIEDSISVFYASKEDVRQRMEGASLADYVGMRSEKGDVYLPPLCKVICKLGKDGARKVVVTKLASSFEGVVKAHGLGMGGAGGGAGSAISGGGLLGITWGTARNFKEEKVNVVGIGFKNPTPKP